MRGPPMTMEVYRGDSLTQLNVCGTAHQARNVVTAPALSAREVRGHLVRRAVSAAKTVKRGRNLGGRGSFSSFTKQAE